MIDPSGAVRLWRLRKRHLYVDAELRSVPETGGVELKVFYGGALTSARRFPDRASAVEQARTTRAELEREGWTFHW